MLGIQDQRLAIHPQDHKGLKMLYTSLGLPSDFLYYFTTQLVFHAIHKSIRERDLDTAMAYWGEERNFLSECIL